MNGAGGTGWAGPQEIWFGDSRAVAWRDAGGDPGLLRDALGATGGRPVIVVSGGADNLAGAELARAEQVLGPAVSAAAGACGAVVIDGGTSAGVMKVIGAARARRPSSMPVLLGVVPAGQVTYPDGPDGDRAELDENHTHFVLAQAGEWGGETGLLISLAAALADPGRPVMVLAGGGAVATSEVLAAVRRGWPAFVMTGTGGTADDLLRLHAARHPGRWRRLARRVTGGARSGRAGQAADTPDLREIMDTGDLRPVTDGDPGELARQLAWEAQDEPVLKATWQDFAACDRLAKRLRKMFAWFQSSVLLLGVLATLLALIYDQAHNRVLHWAVVAVPVVASVLIAVAGRHAAGQRWVLLRAAAEALKSEIFRYRTRTSPYREPDAPADSADRGQELADRTGVIQDRLMQTEVSSGQLPSYDGPLPPPMYPAGSGDDGLSPVGAERYLALRLRDQLGYYHGRVGTLSRRRALLQLTAISAGAAGTILAAAGQEIWVGLTGGIAAAALAYLGYMQVDNTIVIYNQAAAKLAGLERRWLARSPAQREAGAFDDLVGAAEDALAAEHAGWVQQMNDAMADLKDRQDKTARESTPAGEDHARPAEPARPRLSD